MRQFSAFKHLPEKWHIFDNSVDFIEKCVRVKRALNEYPEKVGVWQQGLARTIDKYLLGSWVEPSLLWSILSE